MWLYNNEELVDIPTGYYGFIYQIDYEDGSKYIGMKSFYSEITIPALKSGEMRESAYRQVGKNVLRNEDGKIIVSKSDKAKARKMGLKAKRELYDVISKESDWKSYSGSMKQIALSPMKTKTILQLCSTKKSMTYNEARYLFKNDVLEDSTYLNDNILGKFY